jgi:hypothetical protein
MARSRRAATAQSNARGPAPPAPYPEPELDALRCALLETRDFAAVPVRKLVQLRANVEGYRRERWAARDRDLAHAADALQADLARELERQRALLRTARARQRLAEALARRPPPAFVCAAAVRLSDG